MAQPGTGANDSIFPSKRTTMQRTMAICLGKQVRTRQDQGLQGAYLILMLEQQEAKTAQHRPIYSKIQALLNPIAIAYSGIKQVEMQQIHRELRTRRPSKLALSPALGRPTFLGDSRTL